MQTVNANPNVKVTGRHLAITDAINDYATRKIEGLHLDYPKIIEAHVILGVEKYRHWAEVVLVCSNHITIEAREETNDLYAALDAVTDKIARQMRKLQKPASCVAIGRARKTSGTSKNRFFTRNRSKKTSITSTLWCGRSVIRSSQCSWTKRSSNSRCRPGSFSSS